MTGICFRYKNKMIYWSSGWGYPNAYVYAVMKKKDFDTKINNFKKRVTFSYHFNHDNKERAINRLKDYIDKHYDELSDCPFRFRLGCFNCKNVEEIK